VVHPAIVAARTATRRRNAIIDRTGALAVSISLADLATKVSGLFG
jgi:hypothetical protein